MCELCLRSPCASRCPNSNSPPTICVCDECGDAIEFGGDLWTDSGDYYYCSKDCAIKGNMIEKVNYDESILEKFGGQYE